MREKRGVPEKEGLCLSQGQIDEIRDRFQSLPTNR